MDVTLKHPFTSVISGPSGCGKSEFVKRLIRDAHTMIHPAPDKVIWCYGVWQKGYEECANVDFREGFNCLQDIEAPGNKLLIIDDLMMETDKTVSQLFTKQSHHYSCSVIYITQNLFSKNKEQRTINLNTHYLVLFKNPRDASQIMHLAKQMYPGHTMFIQEAYRDATSQPYGYLLVDFKQDTPEHLRLRTNIFPGQIQYVYLKR